MFRGRPNPYTTGRRPWRSDPYDMPDADGSRAAKQKIFYVGVVVFFVFGLLTLQLARLQLIKGDSYQARAENNRLREVPVIPTRGLVYDRNGLPLVKNEASFAAAVVAADLPEERQSQISIALQEIIHVPAGEIVAEIEKRRASNDPFAPAVVADHLPQDVAFRLRENLSELPGVQVIIQPERRHTEGSLFAHILGYVGPITEEEYGELAPADYELSDRLGKAGVELTYESVLRGQPGTRDVETDASGRELRVLDEDAAKPGNSIVLSVDTELQRHVTEYLQAAMGTSLNAAAVVIDVKTGEILSLVSLPSYDGNTFTGEIDAGALDKLLTDPRKPLLNHAIAEMYPPGSTFKQVTGIGALQDGIATPNTVIFSPGVIYVQNQYDPSIRTPFKDWSALGSLNFYRGVAMSSDVYFYYLAGGYSENGRDLFQGLGAARLADWARRFGLGAVTGIDIPGESAGFVPDPAWKQQALNEVWTLGDTYNFGIGQGYLTTTPLQMAVVSAAVANGGDVVVPHVVKEIRNSDGQVVPSNRHAVVRKLNVDPRNVAVMREGMRQAVADGTASTAKVRNVQIGGKTGTAEFGERRPDGSYKEHGWFTGFGPFENPEIAVSVFLEQGGGALTAAPVAAKIFDYYFNQRTNAQVKTP